MRNVRIFYKKYGRLKFISHLDMTRFMARLIAKSKIPVWYTEGFNQHIYLNFALPLSLGFESDCEILDIRITDENFSNKQCLEALKEISPADIEFYYCDEPKMTVKEIGFCDYSLDISRADKNTVSKLQDFLNNDSIICEKKSKKGKMKEIDLIPKIKCWDFSGNLLNFRLVAGTEDNLNPTLIMDTFFEKSETEPFFYTVKRLNVLDRKENKFI